VFEQEFEWTSPSVGRFHLHNFRHSLASLAGEAEVRSENGQGSALGDKEHLLVALEQQGFGGSSTCPVALWPLS
jgi:hypothetical protein